MKKLITISLVIISLASNSQVLNKAEKANLSKYLLVESYNLNKSKKQVLDVRKEITKLGISVILTSYSYPKLSKFDSVELSQPASVYYAKTFGKNKKLNITLYSVIHDQYGTEIIVAESAIK